MKKLLTLIACMMGLVMGVNAQDLVAHFLKKQDNPDMFTQVNISAKMFQLIADMTDKETESIVQGLTGMRIITTDQDHGDYFKAAGRILEDSSGEYENLMDIKEGEQRVGMYVREIKGRIVELVILVGGDGEFVLMNFMGIIDLKKIAHLTKSVNINGIEYLNKVKAASEKK